MKLRAMESDERENTRVVKKKIKGLYERNIIYYIYEIYIILYISDI
jgi:hypothetical protein